MSKHAPALPDHRPPSGVMRRCRVVEVYDGDTVTVEIVTRARVRLLDCWAPEIKGTRGEKRELALRSKQHLAEIAEGREGEVFLPLTGADRLDDLLTMGRVLGSVYIGDKELSVSEQQVAAGMASTTKGGELGT